VRDESILDFAVTWDRGGLTGLRVDEYVMPSAIAFQNAPGLVELSNNVAALHRIRMT